MSRRWQDDLQGPGWARWMWSGPFRRLLLSLLFLAGAGFVLWSAFRDPDGFFDDSWRAGGALIAAPMLILAFGATLLESLWNLARFENPRPLLTRMPSFREGMPWTALAAVAYVALIAVIGIVLR